MQNPVWTGSRSLADVVPRDPGRIQLGKGGAVLIGPVTIHRLVSRASYTSAVSTSDSHLFSGDRLGLFVPKKRVKLVEFDRNRAVLDMALGRVIIEQESVRFHRNGKGRGIQMIGPEDSRS